MIKEHGIDNIYVVHGITGYEERERFLDDALRGRFNLDFEFVTELADSGENEKLFARYFVENIRNILPKGALYCTLIHILIYEKIVINGDRFAIVFENDICFLGDTFVEKIGAVAREASQLKEGFLVSLENSTLRLPSWRETKTGKLLYPASRSRCAGAYMLDRKAAENMLQRLKSEKCYEVIDWWHNSLIREGFIDMYWAHPPLTEQGSFNGKYVSSTSSRSNSHVRRVKWLCQKFLKTYVTRWFR